MKDQQIAVLRDLVVLIDHHIDNREYDNLGLCFRRLVVAIEDTRELVKALEELYPALDSQVSHSL